MRKRREYPAKIVMNRQEFLRVIIDPHYQDKHGDSVNDELILKLVNSLNHQEHPVGLVRDGFYFLKIEPVRWLGKPYRLILTFRPGDDFLGVINAFRVED